MSQDSPTNETTPTPAAATASNDKPDHVILVSYPKIMYLYPTVITALFCGIFMWAKGGIPLEEIRIDVAGNAASVATKSLPIARAAIGGQNDEPFQIPSVPDDPGNTSASQAPANGKEQFADGKESEASNASASTDPPADSGMKDPAAAAAPEGAPAHTFHNVCARLFLTVLALNLVVISFDFPRTTSLTWFFAIIAIVIAAWVILTKFDGLAPEIVAVLLKIKPAANASFYLIFAGIMIMLYLGVLISRRFDYWEVKGNELLHHHGFLSNLERFSAPNLRIDKEINDVFEYMLLRSGRLIIHASNERRAIVLDNVLFINDKEERITKMLGALQVRVRTERE